MQQFAMYLIEIQNLIQFNSVLFQKFLSLKTFIMINERNPS